MTPENYTEGDPEGDPEGDDAILLLDPDGRIRRLNEAACSLIGRRSEVAGRRLEDVWPAGSALRPMLAEAFSGKRVSSKLSIARQGRSVEHVVRMLRVRGPEEVTDVLVSIRSLEVPVPPPSSDEGSCDLPVLGRLIAHVAHKLKNSLNLLVLHGALLREKVSGRVQDSTQHLDALDAEVLRLNQVIQGLMKFAASDCLEMLDVPVETLIHAAAAEFTGQGKNREIGVEVDVAAGLSAVRGDRELLQQALTSLLSHARSTMLAGGALRVSARHLTEDRVALQVQDASPSGADPSAARLAGGEANDIELFIADRIVRLHGGRLQSDVSARPPSFTLTLPRAPR